MSAVTTDVIKKNRPPIVKKNFAKKEPPKPGPDGTYPCKKCGRKIDKITGKKTTEYVHSFSTIEALEEHDELEHKLIGSDKMIDTIEVEEEFAALRLDTIGQQQLGLMCSALMKDKGLDLSPS